MSDTRLKVAVVGAGGWGRQHARVFSARPDVDFCAVAGRNPEKTARRAAEYGVTPYTDIAQMLDKERPDLVSVCLPNQAHFAPTLQVIQAGYPLLVEKPLVFDLAEADTLLAESKERGLFFAINFNHRYAVPVQKAKGHLDVGRLGVLDFASWRFGGEGGTDHPFGNLIETQCHGFDMLEYLCGQISHVSAVFRATGHGGFQTMAISVGFQNGAVGQLLGSYRSSYSYPDSHRVEVNGEAGRILIEDTIRRFQFQEKHDETAEVWQAGYFNDRERQFEQTFNFHVDELLLAFRRGDPPPIPADAGRRALLLAHAAIRSWETGQRVDVAAFDAERAAGKS